MSPLRLSGSTSGYSQLDAPAIAGDQTFTLPGTGGTIDRLNRAGNILQVVSAAKTDAFSTTSTSFVDVTVLSVSITPTSSTSKILIYLACSSTGGRANVVTMNNRILRDSTVIYNPGDGWAATADNSGDQPTGCVGIYLDSPNTTSSVTYKLQIKGDGALVGINRAANNSTVRGNSSITVMEVAA